MLRAGTQTGSLVNHVYSRFAVPTPEVGMPATILGWTDRHPATVVEVFTKGKSSYVVLQQDSYKRIDNNGMSDAQEYEYSRNPQGQKRTFRISATGGLEAVHLNDNGRYVKSDGGAVIGVRERYYDFSF